MIHALAERHARPGNPLASRSRAALAFHARWRHFPDDDADRARLLDNERTPFTLIEARFPAFESSKEPVFVNRMNAREAWANAWVDGDKEINKLDPVVETFASSIKCDSIKRGNKKNLPKIPGGRGACDGVYKMCQHDPGTTEINHEHDASITRIPACVSKYTKLRILDLPDTGVSRIENIDENVNLEILWLSDTDVSKIENLVNNVKLKELWLENTPVSKIDGLDKLVNLEELGLSNTKVRRIEGLVTNTKLEYLGLNSTPVSKIEGLDNLVNLKKLWLGNTDVIKIENIEKNVNLRDLGISGTVPVAERQAFKKQRPDVDVW